MTLRAGIIGAGGRAQVHLSVLSGLSDLKIVGIADVDRSRAERAVAQFGGRPYTRGDELMDAEKPDVVFLIVPYFLHKEVAWPAIERKIPFFIEKPLSNNLADAVAIAEAVERAGLLTSVGYQWRYRASVDQAREILGNEPIGMIVSDYIHGWPNTEWSKQGRLSGGQILAQMTHLLDLARYFAGDVESVYAQCTVKTRLALAETGNWDNWSVTVRFKNGTLGNFWSTYSLFPKGARFDVVADEKLIGITGKAMTLTRRDGEQEFPDLSRPEIRMHQSFVAAIRNNDPSCLRSTVADALWSGLLSYAAVESARTGQPVSPEALLAQERRAEVRGLA
ncbi:MAG TPA: Gfo/Idh/MocA family oxidoreductase [Chloroflexota bacterium]|nr:Gfo/Idh/MocA family oxidoreductase [Chloroflexota bacterium]